MSSVPFPWHFRPENNKIWQLLDDIHPPRGIAEILTNTHLEMPLKRVISGAFRLTPTAISIPTTEVSTRHITKADQKALSHQEML
jgi:hypothetical protein